MNKQFFHLNMQKYFKVGHYWQANDELLHIFECNILSTN